MCLSFYHNLSSPHCLFQRRDVNDPENICLMRIASGWTLILEGSEFLRPGAPAARTAQPAGRPSAASRLESDEKTNFPSLKRALERRA